MYIWLTRILRKVYLKTRIRYKLSFCFVDLIFLLILILLKSTEMSDSNKTDENKEPNVNSDSNSKEECEQNLINNQKYTF